MQAVMKKAVRVGRTTALAVGVGVMLALVLGAATVALAAVPGDPFRLGQVNIISNATTTLQGNPPTSDGLLRLQRTGGIGAALKVENTHTGIARGIDIKVAPNRSPISVNPDAGKASGLNVDRLDGRDQGDFLSSRIYGKTALKNGPGGGQQLLFTALDGSEGLACDGDDMAIDAGVTSNDINDDVVSIVPFGGSYQIRMQDNGDGGGLFRATVLCSDSASPFRSQ